MKFQAVSLVLAGSAGLALANPKAAPAPTPAPVPLAERDITVGENIDSFLNKATSAVGGQASRVPSFYSSLVAEGSSAVAEASSEVAEAKSAAATAVGSAKSAAEARVTSAESRYTAATGAVGRVAAAASSAAASELPDKDNAAGPQAASRSGLMAAGAAVLALVSGTLIAAPLW